MKLRALIETDSKHCGVCEGFPACEKCFVDLLIGMHAAAFDSVKMIDIWKG